MGRKRAVESEKFTKNPFLKHTAEITKIGQRKLFNPTNREKFMVTDMSTGESVPAGIYFHQNVDRNEFVKLYAEGAAAIMGLKSAGKKVFQILYGQLMGKDGKNATEIILNYDMLPTEIQNWISRTTFDRGINELIKTQFIAQTYVPTYYFINPAFIFNGDRLLIAKAYTIKNNDKPFDIRELTKQKRGRPPKKIEEDEPINLFEKEQ